MNRGRDDFPLLDFDESRSVFVDPAATQNYLDAPSAAVACFFPEVVEKLAARGRPVADLTGREALWEVELCGERVGVFYPGLGAPLAACTMERVIATGCRAIVACGGAGALVPELTMGQHVITVTSALRDEGTSFHYAPPSRSITVDIDVAKTLHEVVEARGLPSVAGKTWTTDGLFRETPQRVARRRAEGCITVEMEASALIAVAAFRGIRFGQYLYAADDLSGDVWNDRNWRQAHGTRQLLTEIAAEAAASLATNR